MPRFYPIFVTLEGRRTVVIGGGSVAARKIPPLLECGARVVVVSPEVAPEIEEVSPPVEIVRRGYREGDLAGAFLAFAASSDEAVNAAVAREAEREGILANIADDHETSTFLVPALTRRGPVAIAVSTAGSSPALAARVRRDIQKVVGEEYGVFARLLGAIRPEVLRRIGGGEERARIFRSLAQSEALEMIRRGAPESEVSAYLSALAFEGKGRG